MGLFGLGDGASTPARAELLAERFGPAHYGVISGIVALFLAGARAAGPYAASLAWEAGGGYDPLLWIMTAALVVAGWFVRVSASAPAHTT